MSNSAVTHNDQFHRSTSRKTRALVLFSCPTESSIKPQRRHNNNHHHYRQRRPTATECVTYPYQKTLHLFQHQTSIITILISNWTYFLKTTNSLSKNLQNEKREYLTFGNSLERFMWILWIITNSTRNNITILPCYFWVI